MTSCAGGDARGEDNECRQEHDCAYWGESMHGMCLRDESVRLADILPG